MAERAGRFAPALLAALVVSGPAACGDDGGASDDGDRVDDAASFAPVDLPPEAEPYVDALVVSLTSEPALPIADDQARCIAGRMVQVFRVERLEAAGIEPDTLRSDQVVFEGLELTGEEGLKLADAFQQCDFDLYGAFVDSVAAEATDPAAARRCFEATLSRDVLRQAMAESFLGAGGAANTAASEAMFEAMSTCTMEFEQIEGEL